MTMDEGTRGTMDDKRDAEYRSVNTESLFTDARGPSVVVHIKDDGTIVADGPDSQLSSGDSATPSDVTNVLQSALDNAGHVTVKKGTYTMGVGGQDVEEYDYCLSGTSHTDLEIEAGATLEYPADASDTSLPDVATPIWCDGITNFRVRGRGAIDAGVHIDTQGADSWAGNAMGVKIGSRHDTSTACQDVIIRGITCTGAWRHFIEASGGSERVLVENCLFDDASGDDDVSYSYNTRYCTMRDLWSINKDRQGSWDAACFEAEDGADHILMEGLYCIEPSFDGLCFGKSHPGDPGSSHHTVRDSYVIRPALHGVVIPARDGGESTNITADNLTIIEPGKKGFDINVVDDQYLDIDITDSLIDSPDGVLVAADVHNSTGQIDITLEDNVMRHAGGEGRHGVSVGESGTIHIEAYNNDITADLASLQFYGANTQYQGDCLIKGNDLSSIQSNWQDRTINFSDSDSVREHVRTIDNGREEDFSPVEPTAVGPGEEYLDDGTNTGSGTKGKRAYTGSAWVDVWTA